jgi:hypothetical protein
LDKGGCSDDLTLPEPLNILADALGAREGGTKASGGGQQFISSNFPLENVCVFVDGSKVTSSVKSAL